MKATLSNFHQSPRKVGLVAGAIRGKSVAKARDTLAFLPHKSSAAIRKLLDSAVANARTAGADETTLFIKTIGVDKGSVMRRFKPMARGRAAPFRRTMSHVTLVLGARGTAHAHHDHAHDHDHTHEAPVKKVTAKKTVAKKSAAKKTTKTAKKATE
jgi:large subunit ribosomal protein L22